MGSNNGIGRIKFGPVCQGSGKTAITGQNARNFGAVACQEMGFGRDSLEFIGRRHDYEVFSRSSQSATDYLNRVQKMEVSQTPSYQVSGALCPIPAFQK